MNLHVIYFKSTLIECLIQADIFQRFHFTVETIQSIYVNSTCYLWGFSLDKMRIQGAISMEILLYWKLYGNSIWNLHVIYWYYILISNLIHTDIMSFFNIIFLPWKLWQLSVLIKLAICVDFLLLTCRFKVKFPHKFYIIKNVLEMAYSICMLSIWSPYRYHLQFIQIFCVFSTFLFYFGNCTIYLC